jgi:hypothetical protein
MVRVLVSSWSEALRSVELADIEVGNVVYDTPDLSPALSDHVCNPAPTIDRFLCERELVIPQNGDPYKA